MGNEKFCSNSESLSNEKNVKALLSELSIDVSIWEKMELMKAKGDLQRILQSPKWKKVFLLLLQKINSCEEVNDQLRELLKYEIITMVGCPGEISKIIGTELVTGISSKSVFQKIFQRTPKNDYNSPFSFHERELDAWMHYMNQAWWTDEETLWATRNVLEPLNKLSSYRNNPELQEFKQILNTKIRKDGMLEKWIAIDTTLDTKIYTDFLFDVFGKENVVRALARKNPESAIMLCQTFINEPWAEGPFQVWENKQNAPPVLMFADICFPVL